MASYLRAPLKREAPASKDERMLVVVVRGHDALENVVPAWEALATQAIEPNVFYEPWLALPALKAFGGDRVEFVLVFANTQADSRRRLCGLFPLERQERVLGRWPARGVRLWRHPYCFLCTPLLRRGDAEAALRAFFDWLSDSRLRLVEFGQMTGDGPLQSLLVEALRKQPTLAWWVEWSTRALFRQAEDGDEFLRGALTRRRVKELLRLERRLAERGEMTYAALEPGGPVEPWIEEFLTLEAQGWKGRTGTAMAAQERHREFFRALAREAHKRGRLMMMSLRLDGQPLAHKCNLLAEQGGFCFKIAYDEAYSTYSPGVLLELEHIRRLHRAGLTWMDSCAAPNHAMINRLWPHRRVLQRLVIATGGLNAWVVALMPVFTWLKANIRSRVARAAG